MILSFQTTAIALLSCLFLGSRIRKTSSISSILSVTNFSLPSWFSPARTKSRPVQPVFLSDFLEYLALVRPFFSYSVAHFPQARTKEANQNAMSHPTDLVKNENTQVPKEAVKKQMNKRLAYIICESLQKVTASPKYTFKRKFDTRDFLTIQFFQCSKTEQAGVGNLNILADNRRGTSQSGFLFIRILSHLLMGVACSCDLSHGYQDDRISYTVKPCPPAVGSGRMASQLNILEALCLTHSL